MQSLFIDQENKVNKLACLSNNQLARQSRISLQYNLISNTLGSNSKLILLIQTLHCETFIIVSIIFPFSSIYGGIYKADAL